MPIDAKPAEASDSANATTVSRWPPRPCCWMMIGQPPGGGVPLGIVTVKGICGVVMTIGFPLPSRVKRSSFVSDGDRQLRRVGGQVRGRSVGVGVGRVEARAPVVAGRDRRDAVREPAEEVLQLRRRVE